MSGSDLPAKWNGEISLDTNRLIGAITSLKEFEERLPLMNTVNEVENWRVHCQAIQTIMRRKLEKETDLTDWLTMGKELELWAGRVAMMCMRRIGQILEKSAKNKGGRPSGKTGRHDRPVSTLQDLGIKKDFSAEAQILASIPEPEFQANLEDQMEKGKITKSGLLNRGRERKLPRPSVKKDDPDRQAFVQDIIAQYKAKGEEIDERRARTIASKRISKYRNTDNSKLNPKLKTKIADDPLVRPNFRRCWIHFQKLLESQVDPSELEEFQNYLFRNFDSYRKEQEKVWRENQQERKRQKDLAELRKP